MYAHILSSALNDWVDEAHAATPSSSNRARVPERDATAPRYHGETALVALAAEVAYDRALIKLCEAHGIDVVDMSFLHPRQERARP